MTKPGTKHGVLERKISFPPEAVFLSIAQDGDEAELWKVLVNNCRNQGNVNVNRRNHAGVSAVHQSVLNNNANAVKMLLTHNADVNMADANGYTPLHTAAACGFLQIASLLIVFGADLFLQTKEGDLAVDLAKDSATALLLEGEMLRQIQQRTYLKAWLWYHLKEYSLWLLQCLANCLRASAGFVVKSWQEYRQKRARRLTNSLTSVNSPQTEPKSVQPEQTLVQQPADNKKTD